MAFIYPQRNFHFGLMNAEWLFHTDKVKQKDAINHCVLLYSLNGTYTRILRKWTRQPLEQFSNFQCWIAAYLAKSQNSLFKFKEGEKLPELFFWNSDGFHASVEGGVVMKNVPVYVTKAFELFEIQRSSLANARLQLAWQVLRAIFRIIFGFQLQLFIL